ncbi:hypothetical protein JHD49_01255 [Sulfurimonas sp. SAG-AH-194-C21]|nr:hypothetical protein [Sulfurimonas sp. SAG-AH-194-C21]MDF1882561.1 hypothetical protein [Sulfurimonas sp. SAG-AH-194-C21]
MTRTIKSALFLALLTTNVYAHAPIDNNETKRERIHSPRKAIDNLIQQEDKVPLNVNSFKKMFLEAKVSGQLKALYAPYDYKNKQDTYTTAVGAIIKYELGEFNGFNAAVSVFTSHDVGIATGSGSVQNPEISSSNGSYTELGEAYLNYVYEDFNIRLGRQVIDTPLADSDEIRMNKNSFEAYLLTYNFAGFEFMTGYLNSWQGYDAGLDDGWVSAGTNGTKLIGVSYDETLEFNAWFYNITGETDSLYIDGGFAYDFNEDFAIHTMVQYLDQKELENSGVETLIYGGLFEFIAYGVGLNIAYDKALTQQGKHSFSGLGGGTLFTSMDTMILDDIIQDEDTDALVYGLTYETQNFSFLYANGDFKNTTYHVKEQDITLEYHVDKDFLIACIYATQEDAKSISKTDFDWDRIQLILNYTF